MVILQANAIAKDFGAVSVLTEVTFDLKEKEKLALIGANGCGKSTLMKILTGNLQPDNGTVNWIHQRVSFEFLSQEDVFDPRIPLKSQLDHVPATLLAECKINRNLLQRKPESLSGGEKTRAALALALSKHPQVLFLDEPTNHLDQQGLKWLEDVLGEYAGTVLLISHDRYFLDKIADRILELEHGEVQSYPGNYSAYALQKQAQLMRANHEYKKYTKEKRRLEESIRRQNQWAMAAHNMHKTLPRELKAAKYYYRSKAKAHMQTVKVMEKRLTTIKKEKPKKQAFIRLTFDDANKVGRNIVLAQNLGFSYDNKRWLFRHTDFFIQRGERVALIGPNGAGKTTLLQVLLGQMNPNEGSIYKAPVKTAYLAQELDNLKDSNTVLEEVTGGNRAENQAYVRTMLGCLLFVGDDVNKKVAALSQGEKARLTIAKILYESPDLLILDEPTNGLDITSRERIEDALESYNGTLIIASHDRFLLRRLTDKIFAIGDGTIEIYPGNYDDFQGRISNTQKMDIEAQCLLLDTRLAQMSAALIDAPADEKEMLTEEFIKTSRQLRALKEKHELPF